MNNPTRTLLALALASAFFSAATLADPPAGAGNSGAAGNSASAPPASDTMPPKANPQPADSIGNPSANAPPATANANVDHTNMKDMAKYPPGKGNWWKQFDVDADGLLTGTEALANPFVNTNFATIDANADGKISQAEYLTFYTDAANQGDH